MSPKQCGCWFNSSNLKLRDKIIGGFENIIVRVIASLIIIHEKYNPHCQTDDISLVELEEKNYFKNINLGAICLPNQFETSSFDGHIYCIKSAIGWGGLFETAQDGSDTLQQVVLVIEEGQKYDRIKSGSQIDT